MHQAAFFDPLQRPKASSTGHLLAVFVAIVVAVIGIAHALLGTAMANSLRLSVFLTSVCVAAAAHAGAPAGYLDSRDLCGLYNPSGFENAEPIGEAEAEYPYQAERDWGEGWVLAEFGVTADGRVRDLTVVDAVGAKEFVTATVTALNARRFKPALRNGKPVEQHLHNTWIKYYFEDTPHGVTHKEFPERFETARNRIKSNRFEEAIEQVELMLKVWRLNRYEIAMSSYLLAIAYAKTGDWENARANIEHALGENGRYLNASMQPEAMELLVKARAQASDLAGAYCAFHRASPDKRAALAPLKAEIETRLLSDDPLVSNGKLIKHPLADQPGMWRRQLVRQKFSFANVSGEVKSFRLSCIAAGIEHAVDPEMQWTVPEKAGTCVIRVFGTPGATFKLVEEW
ncbi:MAG: TonB family protein [Micropepsaceae bacterium]